MKRNRLETPSQAGTALKEIIWQASGWVLLLDLTELPCDWQRGLAHLKIKLQSTSKFRAMQFLLAKYEKVADEGFLFHLAFSFLNTKQVYQINILESGTYGSYCQRSRVVVWRARENTVTSNMDSPWDCTPITLPSSFSYKSQHHFSGSKSLTNLSSQTISQWEHLPLKRSSSLSDLSTNYHTS